MLPIYTLGNVLDKSFKSSINSPIFDILNKQSKSDVFELIDDINDCLKKYKYYKKNNNKIKKNKYLKLAKYKYKKLKDLFKDNNIYFPDDYILSFIKYYLK
mgnify:CR=1 FL=1